MWIINSTDLINTIIKDIYDDFEFIEIHQENIEKFLYKFRKTDFNLEFNENIIDEIYAH